MTKLTKQVLYARLFVHSRTDTVKLLLLSCSFSMLLLAVRVAVTGSLFYAFLVWNLFLGFITYAITSFITKNQKEHTSKPGFWLLFVAWLLFIPNSFYIITDFFHLDEGTAAPQWFDLVLIFSFAWNGLLAGIISLRQMERLVGCYLSPGLKWLFLYSIMFLNALGIYIGRYLRYNSWDVVTNPLQLAKDIMYLCIHPMRNSNDWGMIVCFAVLMTLVYKSFENINREWL
jgi:uncharacterized membrane protein